MSRGRDTGLYAGGLLFQQVIAFAAGVLVARWLGPQGYGQVSPAGAVYGVAVILAPLGLDLSLLRHLGERDDPWPDKFAQVARLRRITFGVNTTILAFVAVLAGPWLQAHVYRQAGLSTDLAIAFVALPFAADLAILTATCRACGRVSAASLASLYLQPVGRTAGLAGLLAAGRGGRGVLAATAAGVAAADLARWDRRGLERNEGPIGHPPEGV